MRGSQDNEFKTEIKALIIEEADSDLSPEDINDDEALFGPETNLALDSLDGLQVSMALQEKYGIRLEDSKETRRVMTSINTLADFLRPE